VEIATHKDKIQELTRQHEFTTEELNKRNEQLTKENELYSDKIKQLESENEESKKQIAQLQKAVQDKDNTVKEYETLLIQENDNAVELKNQHEEEKKR